MSASAPDFSAVERHFRENFTLRGETGAALSVWQHGREILHLHGGTLGKEEGAPLWTPETLVPVYSATKGPAALTLLLTLHDAGLDPFTPVRAVWPQLALPLSFSELLSHQAGLPALDDPPSVYDHAAVARALERQPPAWTPGAAHGYHPRTFGFLLDECVRRLTGGRTLGEVWQARVAGPAGIDFHIGGLPAERHAGVARLSPGRPKPPAPDEAPFFAAMAQPGSLVRRAFASPAGLHAVAEMNQPRAWDAALPAFGGVGSARGLGKFYALLANGGRLAAGTGGGISSPRLVPDSVLAWAGARQVDGPDAVLLLDTAFSNGFMMDPLHPDGTKARHRFGASSGAFGHPGAGGSHAFADPGSGLAFAYVMNQMEQGVLPNRKSLGLVEAVLGTLQGTGF